VGEEISSSGIFSDEQLARGGNPKKGGRKMGGKRVLQNKRRRGQPSNAGRSLPWEGGGEDQNGGAIHSPISKRQAEKGEEFKRPRMSAQKGVKKEKRIPAADLKGR